MWRASVAVVVAGACGRVHFEALIDAPLHSGHPGELSLDRFTPAESEVDFPLLVVLDDTRADRSAMQPDASDVRVFDSDGSVLPIEVERAGAAGGASTVLWVRVPLFAGPKILTFELGHLPRATSLLPVWSTDFRAVFHFSDTNRDRDSTGTNIPTLHGALGSAAGPIASALDLHGSQCLVLPDSPNLEPPGMTFSGWIYARGWTDGSYQAVITRPSGTGNEDDFYVGIAYPTRHVPVPDDQQLHVPFMSATGAGSGNYDEGFGDNVADKIVPGSWHHVAGVVDAIGGRLYRDGRTTGTFGTVPIGDHVAHHVFPTYIGCDDNGGGPGDDAVDGILDEVRWESTARSAAWIAADYASQTDAIITYP